MAKKAKTKVAFRFDTFITSRPVAIILSIITALFIWFAITMSIYPTTPRRFHGVPVTLELNGTEAEANGLSVVECDVQSVEVQLSGDRSQIGLLSDENLRATIDVGDISRTGQYTLNLVLQTDTGIEFNVMSISPAVANVKLDKIETRTFDVEPSFPNITVTSGHALNREDVSCSPSTIDITGPSAQLAEIGRAVVYSNKDMEISSSYSLYSSDIQLYTVDGAMLDTDSLVIPSIDFQISIPILTQKELDLTYSVLSPPSGFDLDWLCERLKLSEDSITLASQTSSAFTDKDELSVGYVRLSEIGLDYSTTMNIELEDEYINQSGIQQVTLSLDSTGLSSRTFTVGSDNLSIINQPTNYDFKLVTKRLDITVIGEQEVLDQLEADDIIVTADLLNYKLEDYPSESFTWQAAISFYQQGRVWAYGSYRIALDRMESQPTETEEAETEEEE